MRSRNTASRKALAAVVAEQDKGMEVVAMSRELSTINEQIQNIAQKKDTLCRRMYN